MTPRLYRPASFTAWRKHAWPLLALSVGLLLSLAGALSAQQRVCEHERRDFREIAERTTAVFVERIESRFDALYAARGLFHAGRPVTRESFRRYVEALGLGQRYPGIESMGFVAAIDHDPGEEEYVVVFVEPSTHRGAFVGSDPRDHAPYAEAMERARDTGLPAATERIVYRGQAGSAPGFMLLLPLYQTGRPLRTVEERRRALRGFVFANIVLPELHRAMEWREGLPAVGLDLRVYDGPVADESRLLLGDQAAFDILAEDPPRHRETMHIDIAGRTWTLAFASLPSFHDPFNRHLGWALFLVGVVLTLAGYRVTLARGWRVAERRRHTAALEYQATHDSLTQLLNREALRDRLERTLRERPGAPLALLLIDLDGFKEINDTLGHHAGDSLLRQIGPRLQALLRPDDLLARLGGDEFALVVNPAPDPLDGPAWARRVIEEIHRPFNLAELTVQVDASVGIALHPDHGRDSTTLLRCADVAMYVAKKSHEGYAVYHPDDDAYSPRQLSLISGFGEAMAGEQLVLHYQPKVRLSDRRTVGLEALVRWRHPIEGLILPAEFCPKVERSTLIRPLTRWVAERATAQYRTLARNGCPLDVAFNISARNLLDSDLPDDIAEVLARHRVPPARIEVEITESAIITDPERALETLTRLHALGVRIAIDDFGTGYSSLAYLKRLPVSSLKIDASFVRDMARDENDAILVRSTINLAHNLGLQVVAEGVESSEVLELLERADCDLAQGMLFCPPLPAEELERWLANDEHRQAGQS